MLDESLALPYGCLVPSNTKNAGQTGSKESPPFEEALKRLEGIVDAMEGGDLPLETLLGRFEEGIGLVKACQAKLEEAELKIQQLEKNAAGETVLKPVVSATTASEE
jgi:exodeoxyribonuclease VII small subunit